MIFDGIRSWLEIRRFVKRFPKGTCNLYKPNKKSKRKLDEILNSIELPKDISINKEDYRQ